MSLRVRLVLVLVVAALLPMGISLGIPLLRAGARAEREAAQRLQAARRQAELVLARFRELVAVDVARAALDGVPTLARGVPVPGLDILPPLEIAPPPPAGAVPVESLAPALAERHRLDEVAVLDATGGVLSQTAGGGHLTSATAERAAVRTQAGRPLACAWSPARTPDRSLVVVGCRAVGREPLAGIVEITGGAVALDRHGRPVRSWGGVPRGGRSPAAALPLGDGWTVRVTVPAGDVARVRRELLVSFAGIAPVALGSALLVGLLLAEGIARPVRQLVARADAIAAERAPRAPAPGPADRDEVRRLTRSFDGMLEALAASERQRLSAERIAAWQEMARRLAHEVKNPLSPIQLAVENLRRTREKAPADLDRALREETAVILDEVASLRRLVDEFSQFARLPQPRPVPTDLREVVRQALALLAPEIEARGVEVEVADDGVPSPITADPEQIGRAVKNVLRNALDALEGAPARRVWIRLAAAAQDGRPAAEIEVRDSGPGIPADVLPRVLEPYVTTRADRGGTGLGLAIVHRILAEHGGEVRIDSPAGGGARVVLRLPA